MRGSTELWFATSNSHKFEEVALVSSEFGIFPKRLRKKGEELQSDDVREIAAFAAASAFRRYRRPLICEDTGLAVRELGDFPGPYASFTYRTIGPEGILKLLANSSEREAQFVSALAYCERSARPRIFVGNLSGTISRSPRGRFGFGFDPVFIPLGSTSTLAEMTIEEKCRGSHRALAVRSFASWLRSRQRVLVTPWRNRLDGNFRRMLSA